MTIIEMAQVAKPGEFWTCRDDGYSPCVVASDADGFFVLANGADAGCSYGFHRREIESAHWHRCHRNGYALEVTP